MNQVEQVKSTTHEPLLLSEFWNISGFRGDYLADMCKSYHTGATPASDGVTKHFRLRDIVPDARYKRGRIPRPPKHVFDYLEGEAQGNVGIFTYQRDSGGGTQGMNLNYENLFPDQSFSFDAQKNLTSNPVVIKFGGIPSNYNPDADEFAGHFCFQIYPKAVNLGDNAILTTTIESPLLEIGRSPDGSTPYFLPMMLTRTATGSAESAPVVPNTTYTRSGYEVNSSDGILHNVRIEASAHLRPGILGSDYHAGFANTARGGVANVLKTNAVLPFEFRFDHGNPVGRMLGVRDITMKFDLRGHTTAVDHVRFDIAKINDFNISATTGNFTLGKRGNIVPGRLMIIVYLKPKTNTFVDGCEWNGYNEDHASFPTPSVEHGTIKKQASFVGSPSPNIGVYTIDAIDATDISDGLLIIRFPGSAGSAREQEILTNYDFLVGIVNRSEIP